MLAGLSPCCHILRGPAAGSQLALGPAGRRGLEEESPPSGANEAWLTALPPSPCTSQSCPWASWRGPGSLSKMKNGLCGGHPVSSGQLLRLRALCCLPVPSLSPSHPHSTPSPSQPRPHAHPIPIPNPSPSHSHPYSLPCPRPIPIPTPSPSPPSPSQLLSIPEDQDPGCPFPSPDTDSGTRPLPGGGSRCPPPGPGVRSSARKSRERRGPGLPDGGQEAERAGGARFPPSLPPHSRRWGRGGEQGWRPPPGAAGRSPPPPPRRR